MFLNSDLYNSILKKSGISTLFLFCSLLINFNTFSQIHNYFDGSKSYHYNVRYIDSCGDTITSEKLIIRSTGKRWIFQPFKQKAVDYIFDTDTSDYSGYQDPEEFFRKKDQKYYKKKNKYRLSKEETTGGYVTDSFFYFHPPRTNQYRFLQYSVHPFFHLRSLNKKHDEYMLDHVRYIGLGRFIQTFVVDSLGKRKVGNKTVNMWELNVESKLKPDTEYYKSIQRFYQSSFYALFCVEFGFIKMYYKFENGIKIEFDFVKVEEI